MKKTKWMLALLTAFALAAAVVVPGRFLAPVFGVQAAPRTELAWHHEEMDTERAWAFSTGRGVLVAVIDTGIDIDHPALAGRISPLSYNAYTDQVGLQYVRDDHGHGTHVSGMIAAAPGGAGELMTSGVAPDAEILAIKANRPGIAVVDEMALLRGINYAVENGADIISLSLGRSDCRSPDELERQVIADAVALGVTVICAAGDDGRNRVSYPAAYPETIAVSASKQGGRVDDDYSNYGPEIDVCAPGTDICAAANGGGTASMSGTSMASSNAAGVAALIKSIHPGYTPQQIRDVLCKTARHAGELTDKDERFGYGVVDAYAAVQGPGALLEVTYHFNDGSRAPFTVKAAPGSHLIKPDDPQRAGYVFDAWVVRGTGARFDFAETAVEDALDLEAQWVEKEQIDGAVVISGDAVCGGTLVSDVAGISPAGAQGSLLYSWKSGGTQVGTGTAYVIQSADAGETITLTVTGTGVYFGSIISNEMLVIKDEVTSSVFTVNQANDIISKISEKTTAGAFLNSLNEQGNFIVLQRNGVTLGAADFVGTGTQLLIMNGSTVVRAYTLVVTGDLDGDGIITINDLVLINFHILGRRTLTGVYAQAALVDADQLITINDLVLINFHLLNRQKISPR